MLRGRSLPSVPLDCFPRIRNLQLATCNLQLFHQPMAEGFGNCFALGMHLELFVDPLDMKADCIDAYVERGGCGFVAVAIYQQFEKP